MVKLSKEASQRLVNLLYSTTSTEVASKVPIVTKHLYEASTGDGQTSGFKSALDSLMDNEWNQKPMQSAVDDIGTVYTAKHSNILCFPCPNSFLTRDDFLNMFPINRERSYMLPGDLRDGLKFHVVKARDPLTLAFKNAYYLIFPNHVQACVYYRETSNKVINGLGLNLQFHESGVNSLKDMASPFLGPDGQNLVHTMQSQNALNKASLVNPFHDLSGPVSMSQIYRYSPIKQQLLSQIENAPPNEPRQLPNYSNYDLLGQLTDASSRACTVLVKNLPFGLSKHTLPKLLWNYDLVRTAPVVTIVKDPVKQAHLSLIRFENPWASQRFVRNFHGKHWDSMQHHHDEKKMYEPLMCEIVD